MWLYLAIFPDMQTIMTEVGDETLQFWNVFFSVNLQSIVHNKGCGRWDRYIFGNCKEDVARWSCALLDFA
jgi:hypothetical protein